MYNLDLTKKVVATGVRRDKNGQEVPVSVETQLSKFVTQSLNRVGSFGKAEEVRSLLQKVKTNKPFDAADAEMKIVFAIFQRTETETMLAFADMVEDLNKDFDIVAYEESLVAAND